MDGTLTQILTALYQSHAEVDALRTAYQVAQQRIVELESQLAQHAPKEAEPCISN